MPRLKDTGNKGKKKVHKPATQAQRDFLMDLFREAWTEGIITDDQWEKVQAVIADVSFNDASAAIAELAEMRKGRWRESEPGDKARRLLAGTKGKDATEPEPGRYEVHLATTRTALVSHGLSADDADELVEQLMASKYAEEYPISLWKMPESGKPAMAERERLIL